MKISPRRISILFPKPQPPKQVLRPNFSKPLTFPIIAVAPLRGSHGLRARRAWRMKSSRPEGNKAGLKSRYLEDGPRIRAPSFKIIPDARGTLSSTNTLLAKKFDICYSGAHTGRDWDGQRLWPGDQHDCPLRRCLIALLTFHSLHFKSSPFQISMFNVQGTEPTEVVLREGCVWVVLARSPFILFLQGFQIREQLYQTSSFRVEDVSIQFAEFRSNPLYVKVGYN